ncbi:Homeobox domain-like [Trinorchestia longiramus]|nr:Homeobox domain-like [Trinorchestia longiramus]
MAELARRTTICELRRAGNSVSDIIKSTGYAKSTVYRIVSAFDAKGKVQRSRHSPCSDRKRTKTFLAGLKRTLKSDPRQPMSKLAQKRSVSRSTISRAVKEDLGMKSYNTRVVAYDPSEVPPVMQSKNLASVMVFAAVASYGKVMPPHFIEAGLKINTAEYLKILKDVLMPWIRRNYDPFKVMLVQDSAPAHGAKKVQDFLKENLPLMVPKDIWPSSSPDLNVCDYWLFGVIEEKSNITSHPSVNSLKSAIRRAFRNLDPEDVKRSCSRFRSRISQIIDAKGSHIE